MSDELGLLAHPRPFIDAEPRKAALAAIVALVEEVGARRVLMGLPLHLSGEAGIAAQRATRFAEEVANATGLDVELADERWTTVEATRRLREAGGGARASVDSRAASILLQGWLDRRSALEVGRVRPPEPPSETRDDSRRRPRARK